LCDTQKAGIAGFFWIVNELTVYACAANAGSDAVKQFEEAGFRGVLTKPLDLEALEKFLNRL
jgi:CheY-like chemotaxis protein